VRLHPPPLRLGQRPGLEENAVGDPDLADIVEQESILGARVVDQHGVDRLRQLERVALHPLRVGSRARVLGLKRGRESSNRLVVGAFDQVALATLDLEQMPEIARVEQQLLLGLALLRRAERDSVQAARQTFDDRE
jgi:hypothetical protein